MAKSTTPSATNRLDDILKGALSGPPDRAKVMEIALKLRADGGNAAVLKQLSEQVKEATHKALQEAEHLGEALVKKAHGWGKEIGESLTKALEKAAEAREKAEKRDVAAESPHASAEKQPAGRELPAHPEASQPKSAAASKEIGPQQQSTEKKAEEAPKKEGESTVDNALTAAQKTASAAKHFGEASSPEKKPVERVSEAIEGVKDAREGAKAAGQVFSHFKDIATAGKPIAEVGFKGMVGNLGKAALGSVGGWSGIAAAGQVAGIGAVAVGGGIAVHDGFKLLLNKVGILGGHFDTLSGTVMDWNESTKRSAEIEKKIAESQEAHQQALEQMQRNQQNVRSVYEARDRIEESQKHQKEAAGMASLGAHFAGRFKEYAAGHVASESELQERDKKYAAGDRSFAAEQYAKRFEEKERERQEAANLAHDTDLKNQDRKAHPAGKGGAELASNGSQGTVYAGPVDLQEQVLQEEKAVRLATELRGLARDRTAELQSQLAAMDQQVRAAEHQVAASREQVKAEQERELSEKARMSMMSKEDQRRATEIFKKIARGEKIDRSEALLLQQRNLLSGSLGHKASDRLAEDLDPEFVKWRKVAGGEEGLDQAQQHLKDSTEDLAAAQKEALEALEDFMDAVWDFAETADTAVGAQQKYEDTKADKEGYSHPGDLRPGERPKETQSAVKTLKEAIQASQADFAAAIKEIGDAMVTGAKSNAAQLRGVAVQLHGAHKGP
jgi:hypothetical protein